MQLKMWFEEEGRLLVQLGENAKQQKGVEWEILEKATKEEPHTFTFGEELTSPVLGSPQNVPLDLGAAEHRPEGLRPMAEQDRLFRERAQEREEHERLDEEAQKEEARKAAENETAERTESERIARSKGLRRRVSEEQSQALDEQEEEQEQEDFPEDTDQEQQEYEEELPAEEEIAEEEQQVAEEQVEEEEPAPTTRKARRGARAARR